MIRAIALAISSLLVFAGCGGGSSAPSSPAVPPPAPSLVITPTNAKPAARVAYGSTVQSTETGDMVGAPGTATTGGGVQKPGFNTALSGTLVRSMQKPPLGPFTEPCDQGGTQTISGEIANILTISAGDRINVDSTDCDNGLGEIVNGRMEMTIVAMTGDISLGPFRFEVDVDLIDFEVATATDTILSNGDSTVVLDTTGNPIVAMSISGTSMTVVSNASSEVMSGFSTSQTVDTSVIPEPYTLTASGTVDSTQIGGAISYETPVTFQGAGAGYPYSGQLLISGADGATVRLIALDDINVRIEADTNGDGTVDDTEDTTWDDIAAAPAG